jgi:preprotein translocase subunit SecY
MWLGEQITSRGIGNGISLIVLSGIVAELPGAIASLLELSRQGALPSGRILDVMLVTVAATAFIVFMEEAQRRLPIQYPSQASSMFERPPHLPLKLNASGTAPPIVASLLLLLPITILSFTAGQAPEWFNEIAVQLGYGRPMYLVLYAALTVFFTFLCAPRALNATETAESLKACGGFIPGVTPGEQTAGYIGYVLSRITVIGAAYLAVACVLPELFRDAGLPVYFSASTLLIVVIGTLEVLALTRTRSPRRPDP